MSTQQNRIKLQIDILFKGNHTAEALPTITVGELIEEIITEFGEDEGLEHLNQAVDKLALAVMEGDHAKLLPNRKKQLNSVLNPTKSYTLRLQERVPEAIPPGTQAINQLVYLQEQSSGLVYKLNWMPLIIGRFDKNQPYNDWVGVNLESYERGQRVSRRHAQITVENDHFFVELLAENPTLLLRNGLKQELEKNKKIEIQPDDILFLERSQIKLKFMVR